VITLEDMVGERRRNGDVTLGAMCPSYDHPILFHRTQLPRTAHSVITFDKEGKSAGRFLASFRVMKISPLAEAGTHGHT
jgi:hypothetical protein